MNRAHYVIVRAHSWLAGHTAAWIIGLAVVWMASAPRPGWGQSAWPSYPNNKAISVTSGGNVGIGTSNPANAILDVEGNSNGILNTVYGQNTSSGTSAQARMVFKADVAQLTLAAYSTTWNVLPGWASRGAIFADTNANGLNIGALNANGNVKVYSGGSIDSNIRMYISSGGNVGIGTTNPQYLLSVNGTVGAKEFIVTNTGWSDYVFQPGYRLRPLSEVGAYIQANHHLPDIPSETEVKEKGVGMGEMQSKLLAKVEELTLHMIRADERNNRLEQQNQELRDRIARLEQGSAGAGLLVAGR